MHASSDRYTNQNTELIIRRRPCCDHASGPGPARPGQPLRSRLPTTTGAEAPGPARAPSAEPRARLRRRYATPRRARRVPGAASGREADKPGQGRAGQGDPRRARHPPSQGPAPQASLPRGTLPRRYLTDPRRSTRSPWRAAGPASPPRPRGLAAGRSPQHSARR